MEAGREITICLQTQCSCIPPFITLIYSKSYFNLLYTVCDTELETTNVPLENVFMGNNVNVFHIAILTHIKSETMNSGFEKSKTVDSDSENSKTAGSGSLRLFT